MGGSKGLGTEGASISILYLDLSVRVIRVDASEKAGAQAATVTCFLLLSSSAYMLHVHVQATSQPPLATRILCMCVAYEHYDSESA